MKNNSISFLIIIIFVVVIAFLLHGSQNIAPVKPENIKSIQIGGQNLNVDLALTPAEQQQGLSGRASLAPDEGMLFIFGTPGNYPFWMKDMNFPIDMIWIGEDMRVIYVQKNAEPSSYPAVFGPDSSLQNAKYVLEVVSGFSDKNNLQTGDSVQFGY